MADSSRGSRPAFRLGLDTAAPSCELRKLVPQNCHCLGRRHTDAKLTLSVYQQVLDMGVGSTEALESVLGCSLREACDVLTGRVLVASSYQDSATHDRGQHEARPETTKGPGLQGLSESG